MSAGHSTAELLLRLLRSEATAASTDEATWAAIVELAAEQRVSSLLLRQLRNHAGVVPPPIWRQLSDQSRGIALRSLAFRRDLTNALGALARAGVPVIVLKGGHLTMGVYENGATREMNDLDLLVPGDRASDAANALKAIGYQFSDAPTVAHHRHLPRLLQPGAAPIEVHTTLSTWPRLSAAALDDVWKRAQAAPLAAPALTLCPEDLVLHLCMHAAYDHSGEFGLRPLCDLREIARAFPALDWAALCSRAEEWKCARGTFLMLHQAYHRLGADIPAEALTRLAPADFDDELASVVSAHLFTRKTLSVAVTMQVSRPLAFTNLADAYGYLRAILLAPSLNQQDGDRRSGTWSLLKRMFSLVVRNRWLPARLATGGTSELAALIRRRHRIVRFLEVEAGRLPDPT